MPTAKSTEEKPEELSKEIQAVDILKEPMQIGEVFAKSGMFPDVKTQAQAVVKILAGREMGLTPFESMNSIYIVNNKLAVMADAMALVIKRGNKYDYKIEKLDDQECIIVFYRADNTGPDKELGKSSFTLKDAAKAGLVNKDNWRSYPRNMLFARALSNGKRWYCPDAACGYTVEEVEDITPVKTTTTIELTAEGVTADGV